VRSPGRLEVVGRHPLVLLDGAHNLAGAAALRAALDDEFTLAPEQQRTLVVGLLREEPHEMLAALGIDDISHLVVCRAASPRAIDPHALAKAAESLGVDPEAIDIADSVSEALGMAMMRIPEDGQVVITGSLYVVGEARSILVR
jgi:dihydrofolate synthase/folylpolyglutamate synthase